jgi:hypothetical protein
MFSADLIEVWFVCCVNNRGNSYKGQIVYTNDLIDQYPNLIDVCDQHGRTAAFYYRRSYHYIDMLTTERLNVVDIYGKTPLDFMILNGTGKYEMITNMIQRGAKLSTQYTYQVIRLLFHQDLGLAIYFISYGLLDANVKYNDLPLLFRMVQTGYHINSIKLIELGANPHVVDSNGNDIFDYLDFTGQSLDDSMVLLVRYLMNIGVIIKLRDIRFMANNNTELALNVLYLFDEFNA